ncbi:MAG: HPr family phosphocarrier protein [Candidatus Kapabacteria bacterium]|nr:HPr family phosphocarrier protein [Candidatus Kapabacteria bacterium]
MITTSVRVNNRAGVHTRPAAMLVKLAAQYKSEIYLVRDGFNINAKSIIGVMTLAAEQGCELELIVEGPDETDAASAITELFNGGFGEQM